MNRFFKHLSLTIITISLFASTNTHCMLIKNFAKKSISLQFYSVDIKNNQTVKKNQIVESEEDRYENAHATQLKLFLEVHDIKQKLKTSTENHETFVYREAMKEEMKKGFSKELKKALKDHEHRLHYGRKVE